MDVTARINQATKFIGGSNITDEDLRQEIFLAALEMDDLVPSSCIEHIFEQVCNSYKIRELERRWRERYNPTLFTGTALLVEVGSDIIKGNDDGIVEILKELII